MPSYFFHERSQYRLSLIINFYISLQYIGTRTDVQFDLASHFFQAFKEDWRTMDQDTIEHMCDSIQKVCGMFDGSGRDLLDDPVIRTVALTFMYGLHNNLFPDLDRIT
ncbi:hypothetical protein PSPO01_08846 [Paraphaeosphaeria sporulosa]